MVFIYSPRMDHEATKNALLISNNNRIYYKVAQVFTFLALLPFI